MILGETTSARLILQTILEACTISNNAPVRFPRAPSDPTNRSLDQGAYGLACEVEESHLLKPAVAPDEARRDRINDASRGAVAEEQNSYGMNTEISLYIYIWILQIYRCTGICECRYADVCIDI